MALELFSPPASPGLTSQVATITEQLGAFVADLGPDILLGADATSRYADFARMERLVMVGKTLLAPPGSPTRATGRLRATCLRPACWSTSRGSRPARPSAPWRPASASPRCPPWKQPTAGVALRVPRRPNSPRRPPWTHGPRPCGWPAPSTSPFRPPRERCPRFKATSSARDPSAPAQRINANRSSAHWTDPDGTFCYRGTDTSERGCPFGPHPFPVANRLRSARRASAPYTGHGQVDLPAPATGMVRVDLDALNRGHAERRAPAEFTPLPPFGQEPDPGLDRKPEPPPRR
jgi:hypothetical protein